MKCACEAAVSSNGRECSSCWLKRVRSVAVHYAPSKSKGAIDPDKQKKWDRRLDDYAKERVMGNQPPGTKRSDIELTKKVSDQVGHAISASDLSTVTGG